MNRIYRISGLKNAGSASIVARAIGGLHKNLTVRVDVEQGLIDVDGVVSEYQVAEAVQKSGCAYLGPEDS